MSYITYEVRVYPDGTKEWFVDDKLHRTDGPAVEYVNGSKHWFVDGQRHRTDGPAIERADGSKEWWVEGKLLSQRAFEQKTKELLAPSEPCHGKIVEIDGKKYKLFAL